MAMSTITYVCVYVCGYVCVHVCVYVCVRVFVCVYAGMQCKYGLFFICTIYIYTSTRTNTHTHIYTHIYRYIYIIYTYIYIIHIRICLKIYIHIHIYTYIQTWRRGLQSSSWRALSLCRECHARTPTNSLVSRMPSFVLRSMNRATCALQCVLVSVAVC